MKKSKPFGGRAFTDLSCQTHEELLHRALERAEQRAEPRTPVFLSATVFLKGGIKISGIALDISPLGARIRLNRGQPLTNPVDVSIRGEVVRKRSRIVWHNQGDIGIQYLNPDLSRAALIDLLVQMR